MNMLLRSDDHRSSNSRVHVETRFYRWIIRTNFERKQTIKDNSG